MNWINGLISNLVETVNVGGTGLIVSLFFVSALMEVGIPFPFILDTVLFLTSFDNGLQSVHILILILALLAGRLLGASILYWLSRAFGKAFTNWLGKRIPSLRPNLDKLKNKLGTQGILAVALARLTPGLLLPSTVAAGVVCMPYSHFISGVAISSFIADAILLLLGFIARHGFVAFGVKPPIWIVFVAMLVSLGVVWLLYRFVFQRISRRTIK